MSEIQLFSKQPEDGVYITEPLLYWHKLFGINKRIEEDDETRQDVKLKAALTKYKNLMRRKPLSRFPSDVVKQLEDLRSKYPNFSSVTNRVIKIIKLSKLTNGGVAKIPHLLLVGEPGTGKTVFANKLINILSKSHASVHFGMTGAVFELAGTQMAWESGDAGLLAKKLCDSQYANMFFLADELDKGCQDNGKYGSPMNVLYQVWEKSANNFPDQGLEINIDLSYSTWICTANYLDRIPEPIQDRLQVIEVSKPSKEDMHVVSKSVWSDLLDDNNWHEIFYEFLSDEVVSILTNYSPRKVYNKLKEAAENAIERQHNILTTSKKDKVKIEVSDIPVNTNSINKVKFGFIP